MSVWINDSPADVYDVCYAATKINHQGMECLADAIEAMRNGGIKKSSRPIRGKDLYTAFEQLFLEKPKPKGTK